MTEKEIQLLGFEKNYDNGGMLKFLIQNQQSYLLNLVRYKH